MATRSGPKLRMDHTCWCIALAPSLDIDARNEIQLCITDHFAIIAFKQHPILMQEIDWRLPPAYRYRRCQQVFECLRH